MPSRPARAPPKKSTGNYDAGPTTVGFANIDGTGGGALNLAGAELDDPEGMAFDPANGRLYIANAGKDEIVWAAVDGSGAGVLNTGSAPVEEPEGIAVDPRTQTVYWANNVSEGSIGYASAAGGDGGTLNTDPIEAKNPYKVALDSANGRLYWLNEGEEEGGEEDGEAFYANLDGSGGAALNLPEAERSEEWSGLAIDPVAGRLYILFWNRPPSETIGWINLSGVGGGVLNTEGAPVAEPYGLAFDPSLQRFYWGNYDNGEEAKGAFGTMTLAPGSGGGINIATAPVDGPQDPVVLKSPTGTGVPLVTASGTTLRCSLGGWAPDYPGSYVYGAPEAYAYQWLVDGRAIAGATGSSYTATASGNYSCAVTATNRLGSTTQASAGTAVTIAPPTPPAPAALTLKLVKKKAVKVRAGKVAVVKVRLANRGGTASSALRVCAKLTKKAKKGLVAPKCVAAGSVPAGGAVVAKLRVKTRRSAKGVYKFAVKVGGAAVNSVTARVRVVKAKHKKHGKHRHHKK